MTFEISHHTELLSQVSAKSVDHKFWPLEHFLRQWHLSVLTDKVSNERSAWYCPCQKGGWRVHNRCYIPRRALYSQLSPCGHLAIMDTQIIRTAAKSQAKIIYRRLKEINSRYYRLSLMRTLTWGPYSVHYNGSLLYLDQERGKTDK